MPGGRQPKAQTWTELIIRITSFIDRLGGSVFFAGVLLFACTLGWVRLPALIGPNVLGFLAYWLLAALAYALAVLRLERQPVSLKVIWGLAVLFRLTLLFSPPSLSDDIYRYLWDGHLLNLGINPYAFPVNSPALQPFDTPLRALVNHNWMASPYLPAAQLLFGLLSRIAPQSMPAFQITAVVLDLGVGWLVMDLLGMLGLARRHVLIYLWNPLVVVEFAHEAHIDAWMIFLMVLAFWLVARSANRYLSPIALAAATLTKGLPALLAPMFLRRWGWKGTALYALMVSGALAIFAVGAGWGLNGILDGSGVFGALRIFLDRWNYNSGLYHWLEVALTGVRTPGAVPVEPATLEPIRLARTISAALQIAAVLVAGWLAWRLDTDQRRGSKQRILALLRLALLPLGAYVLFTPTVHPWYVTILIPFLAFYWPAQEESPTVKRLAWPWLYLSCAVAFSYITYLDRDNLRELYWVRLVEYLPCYALLAWAVLSQPALRAKIIVVTRGSSAGFTGILNGMDKPPERREQIEQRIAAIEARIADCQRRLPAHSIPPSILAELDELDEQLAEARLRLSLLDDQSEPSSG
jgi:hypothetical protein